MSARTLSFRLVAASAVWLAVSLVAAGLLLIFLFRDHIERRFDEQLYDHLEELVAASEFSPQGEFKLTWTPSDPRFNRPHSGWYWQITRADDPAAKSGSLWQSQIAVIAPAAGAGARIQHLAGPGDEPLRALVQDITLPETDDHFIFAIAGPVWDIQDDVDRFAGQLVVTLSLLGLGLLAAVLFQVRFGLRPLRGMQRALAEIRSGRAERLPAIFPREVEPVVSELNALLDHNSTMLNRARMQAANLAHALKNPLTVIGNESRKIDGKSGEVLGEQLALVTDRIDRYLSRARAAGPTRALGARASVDRAVEDLRFSLELLHKDRDLAFQISGAEGVHFRGDALDLEEMIGNLMDNACKWARRQVAVSVSRQNDRLAISVEDDGPGIPADRQAEIPQRGRRLDEAVPGSGLGLDIVREIAELYGGTLRIDTSAHGGVRADLDLPAADA
jgi:signal transduction histidine kinase